MNFPEQAAAEPDALKILLGDSLPSDLNVQMKVGLLLHDPQQTLTALVPALLENSKSSSSRHVFPAGIPKQSIHYPIRHARFGKPLSGRDFLLCAPNSADLTV